MKAKDFEEKRLIVDEHFWFTAITVSFNAFILDKLLDKLNDPKIIVAASVINIYAIFLILFRAASHSDLIKYPLWIDQMEEKKKKFYHKGFETLFNIWYSIKVAPIVFFELSGSLFYILLVLTSFLGILFIN